MSAHKLAETIPAVKAECKNSNIRRPRCPKCGGMLLPDISFTGDGETRKVVSVGCLHCGERFYKDHPRRTPGANELNAHKLAGRPGHVIDGRKLS